MSISEIPPTRIIQIGIYSGGGSPPTIVRVEYEYNKSGRFPADSAPVTFVKKALARKIIIKQAYKA